MDSPQKKKVMIRILPVPRFEMPFTLYQVSILKQLSEAHYDFTCKRSGRVGGFIYGWEQSLTFSELGSVSATWHDLDLTLKIMEMPYLTGKEENDAIVAIRKMCREAMNRANKAVDKWACELFVEI